MPVTVVVGGQFGSEGKGKVAHFFAKTRGAAVAVRVGGSNSGHTVVGDDGTIYKFRHLPTAAILPDVTCVIGAGSYIDVDVLLAEIEISGIRDDRLVIDPNAVIVSSSHKKNESELKDRIGSTGSGTGAAVADRVLRKTELRFAKSEPLLNRRFVRPVVPVLRAALDRRERLIIEGTQGFGLSLLHSGFYPNVTSRDTSAAAFVSECGLSPLDVDEVVLVIRAFPIRVSGNSGPLPREIDWATISRESGAGVHIEERTTVTNRIRRVGRFDSKIVRSAIATNRPSLIVLNHIDYVDTACEPMGLATEAARCFISQIEAGIERRIAYFGTSPNSLWAADQFLDERGVVRLDFQRTASQ